MRKWFGHGALRLKAKLPAIVRQAPARPIEGRAQSSHVSPPVVHHIHRVLEGYGVSPVLEVQFLQKNTV